MNEVDIHFLNILSNILVWKTLTEALANINPLPNDKILDKSKLKAIADDKINGTKNLKLV